MSEDEETSHTVVVETKQEPITIESLWTIYTEARLIPMTFKSTGETIYVTAQFYDWIERYRNGIRLDE